jgi:hypothetical protein
MIIIIIMAIITIIISGIQIIPKTPVYKLAEAAVSRYHITQRYPEMSYPRHHNQAL